MRPCSATVSSGTRATTSIEAPHQSIRASRRTWCRCRLRVTTNSAAMPIGTLTRKTQRQPVMPRIDSWPGEEAAGDRAEHARGGEDGHEVAGVLGALARGDDVADDREHQGEQAAGAEALHGAERREHVHRGGERARGRADDEHRDREQEQLLAAVEVAELAVDRRGDRRGDQVGRRHPGLDREAVQVVGDGADRRTDDGLVERREEHAQQQARTGSSGSACGSTRRSRSAGRDRVALGQWSSPHHDSCAVQSVRIGERPSSRAARTSRRRRDGRCGPSDRSATRSRRTRPLRRRSRCRAARAARRRTAAESTPSGTRTVVSSGSRWPFSANSSSPIASRPSWSSCPASACRAHTCSSPSSRIRPSAACSETTIAVGAVWW